MVTRSSDPGWTPIFGLPAVAGIAGATQRLRDGQVVLVDGLSGTVTVIN